MIAKRSTRKDGRSSVRDLMKYLLDTKEQNERVIYSHFSNCLADEPALAMKEIEAVQAMNTRAQGNKTYHLIVSFREGDQPTPEQLGAIEQGMAEALGLGAHQRCAVVHGDTDHLHMHLAISKVHPTTFRMVEPYRDFYHLSAACRHFEQAFGLQIDNGVVDAERISAKAGDYEAHQGLDSFQRWAQGEPSQRAQAALERPEASWASLHQALGAYNLAVRPRGAGFVIVDRDDGRLRIKASQLGRGFGKAALEARLGLFVPVDGQRTRATERFTERPRDGEREPRAGLWAAYQRERAEREAQRRSGWGGYKAEREGAYRDLAERQRRQRAEVKAEVGLGAAARRARYSVLRMARAREEAVLRERFTAAREALRQAHRSETFQQFLERRAALGDVLAVAALRASGRSAPPPQAAHLGGDPGPGVPRLLALDFQVHRNGDVTYRLGSGDQTITDTRSHVLVGRQGQATDDQTLEVALRLGQLKFGSTLKVGGSVAFQARVAQLAGELGMRVRFEDAALEAVRQGAAPRVAPPRPDALAAYARALGAAVIRPGDEGDAPFRGLRQLRDGRTVAVFGGGGRTWVMALDPAQAEAYRRRPFEAGGERAADPGRR